MLLDNTSAATGERVSAAVLEAEPGPGTATALRAPPARRREQSGAVLALSRLVGRRRFGRAVYVGSGYDRFRGVLGGCAGRVTVAAPGLLDLADASVDLAVAVSLLDLRPDPADDVGEIARILAPGGLAVIGAANVLHGEGRGRYRRSGPAVTGSAAVTGGRAAHHPETLMLQLGVCGLRVERVLSVGALSHPVLDRVLPGPVRRAAEYAAQVALAPGYLGPTLFFLARKHDLA